MIDTVIMSRPCGIMIEIDLIDRVSYNVHNKTRQGYARKRILKPAGYLFLGLES